MQIGHLIDIDYNYNSESKTDIIYTDFTSNEFGTTPVEQLIWGEFKTKPVAQHQWEVQVSQAIETIVAAAEKDHDFRPRIKDLHTGKYFLIDTGACLSVYPKSECPDAIRDNNKGLQAVSK